MGNKPRPLGTRAKDQIIQADLELAAAWAKLSELIEKPDLLFLERCYIASDARGKISEARRRLSETLAMRE